MTLKITNGTWQRNVLVRAAVDHFAHKLPGFKKRHIKLGVVFSSDLKRKDKCRGMALQVTPRKFIIKVERSLKPISIVRVLAHEMVHVNQWLTGKMVDVFRDRWLVQWGTRTYAPWALEYKKHPWEREAYRVEPSLFRSFVKFYGSI